MEKLKLNLNLTDFITEGEFGFLRLGMTKEEIEFQKFPPEVWIAGKSKNKSMIWRYGNFELYFNENNVLESIFTDYVSRLEGGESINIIDWWIIPNGKITTLKETLEELNNLKLSFTKKIHKVGYIEIFLLNSVYLAFDYPSEKPKTNHNLWTLTAIGKRETK